jgi:tRNA-dihydrouridine synthase B
MLAIGSYTLSSNILLAPMTGITDPPFRRLCRHYGAGLATSEMLTSDITLWHSKKSVSRLPQADEAEPRSVQIAGTEPQLMAQAAYFSMKKGAQIIDINMGCPAKKVCHKNAGSALMQEPERVAAILKAVTRAVDIPVTLKIRTGWAHKHRNVLQIAEIAQKNNISALTIHGRTRQDAYRGHAEYETIRQVKQAIDIPIIANGDLNTIENLKFVLEYTKADGLMIGRAAQGQPWIFQQFNEILNHGKVLTKQSLTEKQMIIIDHINAIHRFFGTKTGVRIARKHIGWYLDKLSISPVVKRSIFETDNPERQVQLLDQALASPQ